MTNTAQFEGIGTERRIANMLRTAIFENEQGRGPQVYGLTDAATQFRMYQVRVKKNRVQGRSLETGSWHSLCGYKLA